MQYTIGQNAALNLIQSQRRAIEAWLEQNPQAPEIVRSFLDIEVSAMLQTESELSEK